jgi:hypothetical protein
MIAIALGVALGLFLFFGVCLWLDHRMTEQDRRHAWRRRQLDLQDQDRIERLCKEHTP